MSDSQHCYHCGKCLDVLACEECGAFFCLDCYRRYEWVDMSRLCWVCQNEADIEWADALYRPGPAVSRRTGPRPK